MARLRQRLGIMDTFQLVPYRTHGTTGKIYLSGGVLEDEKLAASKADNLFDKLLNMYKRFETDEVPGATVQLNLPGEQQQATTDKEGYVVL